MVNAEKYRDKLLKFIKERDAGSFTFSKGEEGKFWQCGGRRCSECGMSKERSNCTVARLKWLLSEYKEPVKLTKLEYELLKFFNDKEFKYIARDSGGTVFVYHEKPSKKTEVWGSIYGHRILDDFEDLFQFVKWADTDPTLIKDVLKSCEVVNDD